MSKLNKFRFILLVFFFSTQFSIILAQTRAEQEFNFAQKLYEDKLFLLSAEQFREFAEKFPNNEQADDAWFLCGEAHFNIGEYKEAFKAFKELEIGYPRSKSLPVGRFRLAQCQIARGDFAGAAELFKRVAKFHPESEKAPLALL